MYHIFVGTLFPLFFLISVSNQYSILNILPPSAIFPIAEFLSKPFIYSLTLDMGLCFISLISHPSCAICNASIGFLQVIPSFQGLPLLLYEYIIYSLLKNAYRATFWKGNNMEYAEYKKILDQAMLDYVNSGGSVFYLVYNRMTSG